MIQKTLSWFAETPTSCKECYHQGKGCPRKKPQTGCKADMITPLRWCGTCRMHKKGKTFEEDCPRVSELMFNGGRKSAFELLKETYQTSLNYAIGCPYHQYRNPVLKPYMFDLPGKRLQPKLKKQVSA